MRGVNQILSQLQRIKKEIKKDQILLCEAIKCCPAWFANGQGKAPHRTEKIAPDISRNIKSTMVNGYRWKLKASWANRNRRDRQSCQKTSRTSSTANLFAGFSKNNASNLHCSRESQPFFHLGLTILAFFWIILFKIKHIDTLWKQVG